MKSSLSSIAHLPRVPDPAQARAAAKAAWHTHGIMLFMPGQFTSWADQKQAELLAEQQYGKRTKR